MLLLRACSSFLPRSKTFPSGSTAVTVKVSSKIDMIKDKGEIRPGGVRSENG